VPGEGHRTSPARPARAERTAGHKWEGPEAGAAGRLGWDARHASKKIAGSRRRRAEDPGASSSTGEARSRFCGSAGWAGRPLDVVGTGRGGRAFLEQLFGLSDGRPRHFIARRAEGSSEASRRPRGTAAPVRPFGGDGGRRGDGVGRSRREARPLAAAEGEQGVDFTPRPIVRCRQTARDSQRLAGGWVGLAECAGRGAFGHLRAHRRPAGSCAQLRWRHLGPRRLLVANVGASSGRAGQSRRGRRGGAVSSRAGGTSAKGPVKGVASSKVRRRRVGGYSATGKQGGATRRRDRAGGADGNAAHGQPVRNNPAGKPRP